MGISWYSGTVASAIQEAKKQGKTFIVAIIDENGSPDFCSVLESFSSELSMGVCVKYMSNSNEARQFGEFYPVVLIPSLYFIDSGNGVNLETTGGHSDPDKIRVSIGKGLHLNLETPSQSQSQAQQVTPPPETKEATPLPEPMMIEDKEDPTPAPISKEAMEASPSTSSSSSSLSLEERVARAKELLRKKNEETLKEEEGTAKKRELERRSTGKTLQKFKDDQEEAKIRKALEERKREKEAERVARERVKAQIAEDRAEKARKFNVEKEELEKQRRLAAEEKAVQARIMDAERSKVSRLQFRLPDGRTSTKTFDAEAPLSDVFAYVRNDVDKGFTQFSLSTTFPVKKLDDEDPGSSLKANELAPSATIMILPKSYVSSYPLNFSSGSLMSYAWLLLTPLTLAFSLLQSFFSGSTQPTAESTRIDGNSSHRPKTAYKRKSDGGQVRREGNVARLSNEMDKEDDDDDENGTWNGNSTQQM